jgi:uncharacterized protein (DUF58 family)
MGAAAVLIHAACAIAAGDTGAVNPITARWQAWWQARHPRSDALTLTQRNIYIVPTRAGFAFALTLLTLLVATINYQLGLGYLLTFLLAGAGFVSMHITHRTLRGLTLHLRAPQPVFAGDAAVLNAVLADDLRRERYGIGLRVDDASGGFVWTDVVAGGQASAHVAFVPGQRGLHELPTLRVETRFPFGLFRAWSVWRPASRVLVYPKPEAPPAPLPLAHATAAGDPTAQARTQGGETEGVRSYRRGDPLKLVLWKKSARALDAGGELVARDTTSSARRELWLDEQFTALPSTEARLSRLAAWVLAADRAGERYGLRVAGRELAPDAGEAHRRQVLEALALA